jgi:hypothetical protein
MGFSREMTTIDGVVGTEAEKILPNRPAFEAILIGPPLKKESTRPRHLPCPPRSHRPEGGAVILGDQPEHGAAGGLRREAGEEVGDAHEEVGGV